jgi:glycosyltransferase involved in cell wall biosynthesis
MARELRKLGWRTCLVPAQLELRQRLRICRLERPDVILLQQSRHPLNRPRFYPTIPCVFDADDADILDPRCEASAIECCRESAAVIAGSRFLASLFRQHNPKVHIVWTGSYLAPLARTTPCEKRGPVVAWAHSDPLAYPVEAALVRDAMMRLAEKATFTFCLYGVKDSARTAEFLAPLRAKGVDVQTFPLMPYPRFVHSLRSVAVGLHPVCIGNEFSRGKSFGKLLAYLVAGVAVITSDAVDHALFFKHRHNGILVEENAQAWADACRELLTEPGFRGQLAAQGRSDYAARLTTRRAAELISPLLHKVIREGLQRRRLTADSCSR